MFHVWVNLVLHQSDKAVDANELFRPPDPLSPVKALLLRVDF